MSGLSPSGFIKPTLPQIKSELEQRFRDQFGDNIDLSPSGFIGQLIGILSEREFLIWEGQESVYYSQYWNTASGNSLDESAQLVGLERTRAEFSTGEVTFTGNESLVIPEGFEVFQAGNANLVWQTNEEVIISGGIATVGVTATVAEFRTALAGTITGIVSGATGLDSVVNATDFENGRNRELDSEFRLRIKDNLQQAGTSTAEGIRTAVLELDNVISCNVFENVTDIIDGDGRPPHSFEAYVFDDNLESDINIATVILNAKPAGIQTHGVITTNAMDSQGTNYEIKFTRPIEIDIYFDITVTGNTDISEGILYPTNGNDLVKQAVLDYGATRRVPNRDIIRVGVVKYIMQQVAGIVDLDIKLGTTPVPLNSDNIAISPSEISAFDIANIEVTSV